MVRPASRTMSQAHFQQPPPRRPRGRSNPRSGTQRGDARPERNLGAVPELLSSRQPAVAQPTRRRGPHRLLVFGFGLALGYGLAGPLPSQIGGVLAALVHAPRGIAAIVDPLGIGERRVLVMGSDVIGGNTDVMFTVQVKDGITHITQVPRDTYIESDQLGVMKANALYTLGGPESAKSEVGRLVAAPVQRHLKVNLDAVAKVADALGGVDVDVPKRMYYVDNAQGLLIDLYPGRQVLRGSELEGFLRFRHDELGDLGRMQRQRLVLAEVFRKLTRPETMTRLPALLKIAGEDIRTDLTPIEMTQLLTAMTRSRLSTQRLPGRLYWQDELSYWMPDSNLTHPTGNGEEPTL
jgi:LCP family protein required for cell wall assembly